ncbi:MAG TPA: ImmA/IrrE family metallo-endopeptidase [Candidatus Paceibacterota bacterium]|nr:ImmA/IrrE family metallo-endopeptidase [Candidatus Paceibacterota bacterium]
MKHRKKNILRELARHLRLKVAFVSYFDDQTHGKLLPREGRILINANTPRQEHIFTMLHEIGHFLLHFKNPPRRHHPRLLDIAWKIEWVANFCSHIRRQMRFYLKKASGKEWEADLWALCAFAFLAKHFGFRDELIAFLNRHPEKLWNYRLVKAAVFYCDFKKRISTAYKLVGNAIL